VEREGGGQGGEMTQALYARMNNKKNNKKIKSCKIKKKENVVFIHNGILFNPDL
jgi:hypothetical protein